MARTRSPVSPATAVSRPSGFTTAPADIKQFVTPVSDKRWPPHGDCGWSLPVGAPLPCYECHNPHGTTRGNDSLISDVLGGSLTTTGGPDAVRRFCLTCHTTSGGEGWNSVEATYTAVTASETVVGIPRTGGVLALRELQALDGHAEGDLTSCYGCHGDDYGRRRQQRAQPERRRRSRPRVVH